MDPGNTRRTPRTGVTSGSAGRAQRLVEIAERQGWLDLPSYKLEHGIATMFNLLGEACRPVRNALHGTGLGHPVHPMLTDLPIGAWTVTAVLDAKDALTPRRQDERAAAQLSIGVGLVGAAGAALTGAIACPWHGSRFELCSGRPLGGPATASPARFETRVRDGQVQVRRRPPVSVAPPGAALADLQGRGHARH